MTVTIDTIDKALALVSDLAKQVPGIVRAGARNGNSISFTVADMDDRYNVLTAEAGEPTPFFLSDRGRNRMEQVVLKAHRVERGRYGWNDRTRVFKVRKDGTLNRDGILKALHEMVEQVQEAEQIRKRIAQRENADAALRQQTKDALGLELDYNSLDLPGRGYGVVVVRDAGLVDIKLTGLDIDEAKSFLDLLKKIKADG